MIKILPCQKLPNLTVQDFKCIYAPGVVQKASSFYEGDKSTNETLLKFAKLDFNRLQLLYKKQLALLSRWWKDINLTGKLPYTRDRIVEAYLWAVSTIVDPQFSRARLQFAKHVILLTAVDDTYDSYGTFDELELFTAALQRFTVDAKNELPEYMKILYEILWNFFEETKNDGSQRCSCKTSYAIEMLKETSGGYFVETKWFDDGVMPTFNEYMLNGLVTSTIDFLTSGFILGVENLGMKEILWLRDDSKFIKAAKLIPRLFNDSVIRESEEKRGYPSAIKCYMNDHGVSQKKAREDLLKMIENGWKDINEELMNPTRLVPKILLKFLMNFSRVSSFTYKGGIDTYTNGEKVKKYVTALFIDPLPM